MSRAELEGRSFYWYQIGKGRKLCLFYEGQCVARFKSKGEGLRNLFKTIGQFGETTMDIEIKPFADVGVIFRDIQTQRTVVEIANPVLDSVHIWINGYPHEMTDRNDGPCPLQAYHPSTKELRTILETNYMNRNGFFSDPTDVNQKVEGECVGQTRFISIREDDADPWLLALSAMVYCAIHPRSAGLGF